MPDDENPQPPTPPDQPARGYPPFLLLAGSTLALTGAADFLLYGQRAGLGLALFLTLLWLTLAMHRSGRRVGVKNLVLVGLLGGTALATCIAPSVVNGLLLIVLTFYASGHWFAGRLSPYWARALRGVCAFAWFPSTLENIGRGLGGMFIAGGDARVARSAGWLVRMARILGPVALVALPFVLLLGGGNAILGQTITSTVTAITDFLYGVQVPDADRFFFWAVVGAGVFALLGNRLPFPIRTALPGVGIRFPRRDLSISIWRTRLLLVAVNAIFFAANATDLVYLWGGRVSLPEGVTYSEFVHQGVNHLIACVVLAAAVLLLLFNAPREVTHARGQRVLAGLWIAQNLLLEAGVMLRLKLYVDSYGLSVQRVHLMLFLALVGAGFVLLGVRIAQSRSLRWLLGANLLAVFALFFVGQFADIRGFVASYNVRAAAAGADSGGAADLDMVYLRQLAPESWPALRQVAETPDTFGPYSEVAATWLAVAAESAASDTSARDWRSWSWRRERLRQVALGGAAGGGSRVSSARGGGSGGLARR